MKPNKTLMSRNSNIKGNKKIKERITNVIGSNSTGTKKLKPLIIGKFLCPRSCKNKNYDELNVKYTCSTNAWMTKIIWEKYIKYVDDICENKSILLIDNCRPHIPNYDSLQLKNLEVYFLPPNATAHIQPCDADTIQNFKINYKNLFVKKLLFEAEKGNYNFQINISDAIDFVSIAWNNVKPIIINNCWKHVGILSKDKKHINNNLENNEIKTNILDNKINYEEMQKLDENINNLLLVDTNIDMKANEYIDVDNDNEILEKNIDEIINCESKQDKILNEEVENKNKKKYNDIMLDYNNFKTNIEIIIKEKKI
jgi:DDE superfamily endonuclease.